MQYSENFNMYKPELNEQYRLSHWNDNTDIIDNAMQAIRSGTDEVMRATLLNFCYPIGSIYWSGNPINPHDLFGGTWVQIKDKFVWAKGDSDTLNDTGGEKTHTLSVNEMPSHSHTFSGNSVTTSNGGVDHVHGINHRHYTGGTTSTVNTNHTHNFTPSGIVSSSFNGIRNTTISISDSSVSISDPGHSHGVPDSSGSDIGKGYYHIGNGNGQRYPENTSTNTTGISASHYHTHDFIATGTVSSSFSGTAGTTGASNGENSSIEHNHTWGEWSSSPRWWGNEGAERLNSDGASAYLHSHTVTASGSNSNAGGGNAHNNMPPYIVKYCWERTA